MKRTRIVALALACVLGAAACAFAAEGGGEHGLPWMNFTFRVINFVIVIAIVWKLAGKKIADLFRGRQEKIRTDLDDLEARRKEAEGKLREVEKSIADIEQERKAILDEALKQGEALKEALVAEAERKAEQVKAQAGVSIETERKTVLEGLREEVADMIVEAAEKILRDKLTEEEHQKLVDEYLNKVVLN